MPEHQSNLPVPSIDTQATQVVSPLQHADPLAHYRPPYELISDMLFAAAFAPAAPLQRQFPGAPFLSSQGRVPLGMWFSRIKSFLYRDERGDIRHQGSDESVIYYELTIVALLRRRAMFVPSIYATSHLTILIGHYHYGMPKQPTQMSVQVAGTRFKSSVLDGNQQTDVQARWQGSGRRLATLFNHFWPWWSWTTIFPDGRRMRSEILKTPQVHLAHVQGCLALNAAWLPQSTPLLPWGIYVPNLCMELPHP